MPKRPVRVPAFQTIRVILIVGRLSNRMEAEKRSKGPNVGNSFHISGREGIFGEKYEREWGRDDGNAPPPQRADTRIRPYASF